METETAEMVGIVGRPSQTALKRIANEIDFSKKLIWDEPECMSQWYALVEKPPLHSVVVHIEPPMASQILRVANEKNRRMQNRHAERLSKVIQSEDYELTGDTIKFSKTGRLLDGQHRLKACEKQGSPILTHVVFGLEDDIFDVLDQGKRRTPADILGLEGIEYATIVAASVRWVMWYKAGAKATDELGNARKIKEMALGEMRDIKEWTRLGSQLAAGYKHPPSLITGLLYLIAKGKSRALAEEFAQAWLSTNSIGRNRNFSILASRLQQIKNQSAGYINPQVRAALVIQTFNHWNAGIVAAPASLKWRKELMFPKLEFDAQAFAKNKAVTPANPDLVEAQMRVIHALIDVAVGIEAKISNADLATRSNVAARMLPEILEGLVKEKKIAVKTPASGSAPATYKLIAFGKD